MNKLVFVSALSAVTALAIACSSSDAPPATAASSTDGGTDGGTRGGSSGGTSGNPSSGDAGPTPPATGTATYSDNLGDFAFTYGSVIARYDAPAMEDGKYEAELKIELREGAFSCADYLAHHYKAGYKSVQVEVQKTAATAADAEIKPGTYDFFAKSDELDLGLERRVHDDQCNSTGKPELPKESFTQANISVSNVTVTTLTATHVTGTFEITTKDGKSVEGTFDTDFCAGDRADLVCVP